MTHRFMYPKVDPAPDSAPETGPDGPAGSADTHNDTVGGPSSHPPEEQERPVPETGRAAPRGSDRSPATPAPPEGTDARR